MKPPRRLVRLAGVSKLDQPSALAHRTRINNPNLRSFAQESILSCAAVSQLKLSPKILATGRFIIEMLNAVLNEETGELMEYRHIIKNQKYCELYCNSYGKDLGRLAQGIPRRVNGTNTILFINKADVPVVRWKDVTYERVVVSYRPEKGDPYCTQLTIEGNLIIKPSDCGTPPVDILAVKLLINSVSSTPNTKFMTVDVRTS